MRKCLVVKNLIKLLCCSNYVNQMAHLSPLSPVNACLSSSYSITFTVIESFIDKTSEGWFTLPHDKSVICSKPSIPPKSTKTPKSVIFFTLPKIINV